MKIEGRKIYFSSGKTRYANGGIVGIGKDMDISEGSDGGVWSPYETEWRDDPLSKEDLQELADYMIARWRQWRDSL